MMGDQALGLGNHIHRPEPNSRYGFLHEGVLLYVARQPNPFANPISVHAGMGFADRRVAEAHNALVAETKAGLFAQEERRLRQAVGAIEPLPQSMVDYLRLQTECAWELVQSRCATADLVKPADVTGIKPALTIIALCSIVVRASRQEGWPSAHALHAAVAKFLNHGLRSGKQSYQRLEEAQKAPGLEEAHIRRALESWYPPKDEERLRAGLKRASWRHRQRGLPHPFNCDWADFGVMDHLFQFAASAAYLRYVGNIVSGLLEIEKLARQDPRFRPYRGPELARKIDESVGLFPSVEKVKPAADYAFSVAKERSTVNSQSGSSATQ